MKRRGAQTPGGRGEEGWRMFYSLILLVRILFTMVSTAGGSGLKKMTKTYL
jgi:hypothetical protein